MLVNNKKKNIEKVICIQRNSRTIAGGRIMSFSVVSVVGDGESKVGFGRGKSKELSTALQKSINQATKNMRTANFNSKRGTIFYECTRKYNATRLYLKPAKPGSGIIANNTVKAICMAAGIKNVVCKVHGSTNKAVVSKSLIDFLHNAKSPSYFAKKRGMTLEQLFGQN